MLSKINRLSNFKIKAKSERFDTPLFSVKIFSNGSGEAKFGFVVSKKIDKRAVVRNKTRRVLQKASEEFLNKTTGENIIIIARRRLEFKDLKETIMELKKIFEINS